MIASSKDIRRLGHLDQAKMSQSGLSWVLKRVKMYMQEFLWDVEVILSDYDDPGDRKIIINFLLQTCNEVHLGGVGGGARRCRGVTRVMDEVLRWNIGKKNTHTHTLVFSEVMDK